MALTVRTNSAALASELRQHMNDEFKRGNAASLSAMRQAAAETKDEWRGQVRGAGLGARLSNAIRSQAYQNPAKPSVGAWALVWSKAPKITAAHEAGPVIVPQHGQWLAIPTAAAGMGRGGKSITPGEWQFQRGIRLQFVPVSPTRAFLVAENVRVGARGAQRRRQGRRKVQLSYAQTTVAIFILVRQVKLKKKLDLFGAADRVANSLPTRIAALWK
jgi:hypothetical protein